MCAYSVLFVKIFLVLKGTLICQTTGNERYQIVLKNLFITDKTNDFSCTCGNIRKHHQINNQRVGPRVNLLIFYPIAREIALSQHVSI